MWGILKNDYYTNTKMFRTTILLLLGISIPFYLKVSASVLEDSVILLLLNAGYFFLSFIMFIIMGTLINSIMKENEQTIWQMYLATTITGRKGYIAQKYILSMVFYFITGAYAWFVNEVAYQINGVCVSKSFILLFVIFFVFQAALELPCMLRFGTVYGGYIKIILMFAVIFGIIIYGLYGNIKLFSMENQDKIFDWTLRLIGEGLNGPTAKKGILIAGIATTVFYGASYALSLATRKKL